MADILKISTPYIDKSAIPTTKPVSEVNAPFTIGQTAGSIGPQIQKEMHSSSNTLLLGQNSPSMLASLLRDPDVAVNFLKNIYMLQEFIQLIPVHNSAVTIELQKVYDGLMVKPEDIVEELLRQEDSATSYKGELFDFLREALQQNPQKGFSNAVASFLKSLNGTLDKQEITTSLGNNLTYLASTVEGSKSLSEQLKQLADAFYSSSSPTDFSRLKAETLEVLAQVEDSILYSPKQQRAIPLIIHNLSRYNDNAEFLQDTVSLLLSMIGTAKERDEFMRLLKEHIATEFSPKSKGDEDSKVVDALSELLTKQTEVEELSVASHEKMEKILHSLLSSPSNFTPLLHFIVPVDDGYTRAFGEIWIDPNAETPPPDGELGEENMHMLIEFDVESMGQIEVELFVNDDRLSIIMFCPEEYMNVFSGFSENIKNALEKTSYRIGTVKLDKFEEQRSLMQVFKSLPHRRTGINMKI